MSSKNKKKKKKVSRVRATATTPRTTTRSPDRAVRELASEPITTGSLLSGTLRLAGAIGWRGFVVLLLFQIPSAIATWQVADQLTTVLVPIIPQLVAIGAVTELGLQQVRAAPPDLTGAIVRGIVRFPFLLLAMIIAQLIVMALGLLLVLPLAAGFGGYSLYEDTPALGIALFVLAALLVIPCALPAVRRYLAYQLVAPLTITGEYRVVDVLDESRLRMQGHLKAAFVPLVVFLLLSKDIAGLGITGLVGSQSPEVQAIAHFAVAVFDLPIISLGVVLYAKLLRDE